MIGDGIRLAWGAAADRGYVSSDVRSTIESFVVDRWFGRRNPVDLMRRRLGPEDFYITDALPYGYSGFARKGFRSAGPQLMPKIPIYGALGR